MIEAPSTYCPRCWAEVAADASACPEEVGCGAPVPAEGWAGSGLFRGIYRLEARLARGPAFVTFRAEDSRDHKPVILELARRDAARAEVRTRLEALAAEERALVELAEPEEGEDGAQRFPRVYAMERGEAAYLAREYVAMPTLAGLLVNGALGPDEAARIGQSLLAALAVLARRGMVHGGLDAETIWVGADRRVLIGGIASWRADDEAGSGHRADVAAAAALIGRVAGDGDPTFTARLEAGDGTAEGLSAALGAWLEEAARRGVIDALRTRLGAVKDALQPASELLASAGSAEVELHALAEGEGEIPFDAGRAALEERLGTLEAGVGQLRAAPAPAAPPAADDESEEVTLPHVVDDAAAADVVVPAALEAERRAARDALRLAELEASVETVTARLQEATRAQEEGAARAAELEARAATAEAGLEGARAEAAAAAERVAGLERDRAAMEQKIAELAAAETTVEVRQEDDAAREAAVEKERQLTAALYAERDRAAALQTELDRVKVVAQNERNRPAPPPPPAPPMPIWIPAVALLAGLLLGGAGWAALGPTLAPAKGDARTETPVKAPAEKPASPAATPATPAATPAPTPAATPPAAAPSTPPPAATTAPAAAAPATPAAAKPTEKPVEKPAEKPVEKAPAKPSAKKLVEQGWKAIESNSYAEARQLFDTAVGAGGGGDALYGRAYASEKLGNTSGAAQDYCSALAKTSSVDIQREIEGSLRRLGKSCP